MIAEIKADPDISGKFSLLPLGRSGFVLRCDALPASGGAANLVVRMLILNSATASAKPSRAFGVACDYFPFGRSTRPNLVLVTLPYQEVPGFSRIVGDDSIEAWAAKPPSHALLIWQPRTPGEMLQIRTLKLGFTQPVED